MAYGIDDSKAGLRGDEIAREMERRILLEEDDKSRLPNPAFTSLAGNSSDSDTTVMGTSKRLVDTATRMGNRH